MTILLHVPSPVKKLVKKSERGEPTTISILLMSVAIFLAVILLLQIGVLFTEDTTKQYSTCRDKIVGYEQSGIYISPDQFKLGLSYCISK
jgi:hypothetical protein